MKVKTVFRCRDCGGSAPRWVGRCPVCGEWNTLVEELDGRAASGAVTVVGPRSSPVPISDVDEGDWSRFPTGVAELDRVLDGGLVPGSVTLLGGEPGIGKSTLLLQVLAALAGRGRRCLLVSGEESTHQVRLRAARLGALRPKLWLLAETVLAHVLAAVGDVTPDLLVVDSIQTMSDPEVDSAPGSVAQVRACAATLVQVAKQRGLAIVLVGHVTKEGTLAGPRVLEHVVDTVLSFEGDRHHGLRLLRAVKHRFGSTAELGVFEMGDDGLHDVADPSGLFLDDRRPGVPGSAVVPAAEGARPLLVEVQALVASTSLAMPRRTVQGVDGARLALVLAVLERRCHVKLAALDVYASAAGGVRLVEPGTDLALALALASSASDRALPPDVVACGEIGLGGEVRQVSQLGRRLAEAARLGFRRAVVPASAPTPPDGLQLLRVGTLAEAVDGLNLTPLVQ